ncbi:MAG: peptide chain release factor N(5)-glutamine methyltransferase [Planctomycetes bacterium]|nr:peptide chain release factor N(5)-glutamine methyltransferase [Planctomycetota bacterium]
MSAEPVAKESEWTIARLLSWTTTYFTREGIDDPRLSAEVLLAHSADCRRIDLYTRFDQTLGEAPTQKFRDLVKRAAGHEPIAYLVGEKEFFSLPLIVTPEVLIPRSETERLVECVIDHCHKRGLLQPRLWDLGTGSGCIAVALLVNLDEAQIVATDVSAAALEIARRNADRHGVSDRLSLVEADCLSLPPEHVPEGGFDVVMSNPPYVPGDEVAQLDANVRGYEPRAALTDEQDGLSFYRSIGGDASAFLKADGVVVVEVADGCAEQARQAIEAPRTLVHRQTLKDRVVGQERVLMFSPG